MSDSKEPVPRITIIEPPEPPSHLVSPDTPSMSDSKGPVLEITKIQPPTLTIMPGTSGPEESENFDILARLELAWPTTPFSWNISRLSQVGHNNRRLVTAASNGEREAVGKLLGKGADPNIRVLVAGGDGKTALEAAAEGGHEEVVKLLLESMADTGSGKMEVNMTRALLGAAKGRHMPVVELLLDEIDKLQNELRGRTRLQIAAAKGYEPVVKLLLEKEADVNDPPASPEKGRTALQAAAEGGYRTVVKLLLDKGADVNAPPSENSGRTALQAAAEGGHRSVVKLLLDKAANVNAPPSENSGRTALQAAAERGHELVVRMLLEKKADVNEAPAKSGGITALAGAARGEYESDGITALAGATRGGYESIVKLLLAAGANPNSSTAGIEGGTALQAAAEKGRLSAVKLLLDKGADVNAPPPRNLGRTALQAAAEGGHELVVRMLLKKKADVNEAPARSGGITALAGAARGGHESIVRLLLGAGADPNALAAGINGRTALQAAAGGGDESVVKMLLDKAADVNAPPSLNSGRTALQAAAENGHEWIVKMLLDKAADVNASPSRNSGRTALQAAAENGYEPIVKLLLDKDAEVNAPPSRGSGRTALQAAAEGGYESIVIILLKAGAEVNKAPAKSDGITALAGAARGGYESIVMILLEAGAEFNKAPVKSDGTTAEAEANPSPPKSGGIMALAGAARGGYDPIVSLPLEGDVHFNTIGVDGGMALQLAAEKGHLPVVNLLLDKGADVNSLPPPSRRSGRTALQAAAENGYEPIVKLLLDKGAEVNASPSKHSGRTALQAAAENGHEPIVRLLLDKDAKVNAPPSEHSGRTTLQAAAGGGHESIVKILLDKGADVNEAPANSDGITALAGAARWGHKSIVSLLLKTKQNHNTTDIDWEIALNAAAEGGHESIEKLLLDEKAAVAKEAGCLACKQSLHSGCTLEEDTRGRTFLHSGCSLEKDKRGRTLLHSACFYGHISLVEELLGDSRPENINLRPEYINSRDKEARTPLHLAILKSHENIVRLLLKRNVDTEATDADGMKPLNLALPRSRKITTLLLKQHASPLGIQTHLWHETLPHEIDDILELNETSEPNSPKGTVSFLSRNKSQLNKEQVKTWMSNLSTRSLWSELAETTPWSLNFTPPLVETSLLWLPYYEGRGNGWNNGVPNLSKLGDAPVIIKYSIRYYTLKCKEIWGDYPTQPNTLRLELQSGHISWTMLAIKSEGKPKNDPEDNSQKGQNYQATVNTRKYRSTLDHPWIPDHSLEFFCLFIDDLHKKWEALLCESEEHLNNAHRELFNGGLEQVSNTPEILKNLFADAQTWGQFRVSLGSHVKVCTDTLDLYRGDSFFSREIDCFVEKENLREKENIGGKENLEGKENLRGKENLGGGKGPREIVAVLSEKVKKFESRFKEEITALEKKTQTLVDFKLNLLQAYEARKSSSTAIGMERLSWITFVFLPSMFVASLFGMNVNILNAGSPTWTWYPIICIPVLLLVLFVWLACKYIQEKHESLSQYGDHLRKPLSHLLYENNPVNLPKKLYAWRKKKSAEDLEAGKMKEA